MDNSITLSHEQWLAEAERRYGKSLRLIRFVCPSCGYLQSGIDFLDLGCTPEEAARVVGFSCIGRKLRVCQGAFTGGPGPCNYAGGGLFRIAPVRVLIDGPEQEEIMVFDFADEPLCSSVANR